LGPHPDFVTDTVFKRALQSTPGSRALEQARIDYFLERVSQSPYNFIRNQNRYTGKRAAVHLKWKYLRNLFRVKTAGDFIDRVATGSKVSGAPYLVEFPDRRRYPLRRLLLQELQLFDQALEKERQRIELQNSSTSAVKNN
jgi:hypothetical protein